MTSSTVTGLKSGRTVAVSKAISTRGLSTARAILNGAMAAPTKAISISTTYKEKARSFGATGQATLVSGTMIWYEVGNAATRTRSLSVSGWPQIHGFVRGGAEGGLRCVPLGIRSEVRR